MRLWTCVDHDSHWPVGCASIVLADSESEARALLDGKLKESALRGSDVEPYTLVEVDATKAGAWVLSDGDY